MFSSTAFQSLFVLLFTKETVQMLAFVFYDGPCILEPQIWEFSEYVNFINLFSFCSLKIPKQSKCNLQMNDSQSKFFQITILSW